ncbi:MAG: endonuclease I family protein [Pseudobdellovibrio sp.]
MQNDFARNLRFLVSGVVFFILSAANAYVTPKEYYYGEHFLSDYQSGQLKDSDLLDRLHVILKSTHIKNKGTYDTIGSSCTKEGGCQAHTSLGYDLARKYLFGSIHLEQNSSGEYTVQDVYCEKYFTNKDFGGGNNIGPGTVPRSGDVLNTEHTWPQSRFTSRFSSHMQKSDLHHLYPTDSKLNSTRSSLRFGDVDKDIENLKCNQNRLGTQNGSSEVVFEPPTAHKGNVARAIFYFAVRYQMKLSPNEEKSLRAWHIADPVSDFERKRNDMVEDLQGNRNPFVDYPELLNGIKVFTFATTK